MSLVAPRGYRPLLLAMQTTKLQNGFRFRFENRFHHYLTSGIQHGYGESDAEKLENPKLGSGLEPPASESLPMPGLPPVYVVSVAVFSKVPL